MGALGSAGSLVIQFVFGLVLFVLLIRVLLQAFRAPFYHPACQGIFKLTNPLFMPLQKLLPTVRGWHLGGIVLMWLLATLQGWLMFLIYGPALAAIALPLVGLALLLDFVLMTMFWLCLIRVLASWLAPQGGNPNIDLLHYLTVPILGPLRRRIPPIGMFDISPMIALLGLQLLRILIAGPLLEFAVSLGRQGVVLPA